MDWFLYDNGLRHERVKITHEIMKPMYFLLDDSSKNIHHFHLLTINIV